MGARGIPGTFREIIDDSANWWGLDSHCRELESPGVSHLRLQSCVTLRQARAAVVGAAAPSGSGGADECGLLDRRRRRLLVDRRALRLRPIFLRANLRA